MSKKLKKAIRDSFQFPETAHKEEFFGQPLLSENCKRRRNVPVVFRFTAAAAAIAFGVGIWNAVKIRRDHGNIDIPVEMPAETEIISTSPVTQNSDITTTYTENNTVRTTEAVSSKKKLTLPSAASTQTTNVKNNTSAKLRRKP